MDRCRSPRVLLFRVLLAIAIGASTVRADGPRESDRVVLMGASLTLGFGAPPGWETVWTASRRRFSGAIETRGDLFFFANAAERGGRLVEKTLESKPSLVIALDFPFWFGYGAKGVGGGALTNELDRLVLFSRCTALLERFTCPVVLGDFPEVPEAVGRILRPDQVPAPETLRALNVRLREWSARRTNVAVVPISDWVSKIRSGESIALGHNRYPRELTSRWLQQDRLHPSTEGLQALALMVNETLEERGWMRSEGRVRSRAELARRVARALKEHQRKEFGLALEESIRGLDLSVSMPAERLSSLARTLTRLSEEFPAAAESSPDLRALVAGISPENARVVSPLVERSALPVRYRNALRAKAGARVTP